MMRETPKFRTKRLMRALLDFAPPNALINAMLMTEPVRALAQRIYFHSRAGDAASFDAWSKAFEKGELEPTPPQPPSITLRVI
jgi:hypothetical protein